MTAVHIVSGHPRLTLQDVAAAQAYAADVLAMPSIREALAVQDAVAG